MRETRTKDYIIDVIFVQQNWLPGGLRTANLQPGQPLSDTLISELVLLNNVVLEFLLSGRMRSHTVHSLWMLLLCAGVVGTKKLIGTLAISIHS